MTCCNEHGCRRTQPILIQRGNFSGHWYAVTDYRVLDEDTKLIESRQKHQLPPSGAVRALEAEYQRQQATEEPPADVLYIDDYAFTRRDGHLVIDTPGGDQAGLRLSDDQLGALAVWLNDHAERGGES